MNSSGYDYKKLYRLQEIFYHSKQKAIINEIDVMQRMHGFPKFINLAGIESPGLTACLAIAE